MADPVIPQLDRLKAQLLTSDLSRQNQPLFQVINQLIDALRQATGEITIITGSSGGGGGGILSQTFITINNDQATLPNSRQLIPGAGVFFNDQGQKLIISVAIPIPVDGIDGKDGIDGIPGPQGIQGISGPQGIPGIDGQDAESSALPFVGNSISGAGWTQLMSAAP